jgi:hypothetical protein
LRDVITILYNNFETLDVFGPVEIFGRLPEQFDPLFYSLAGGIVTSSQNVRVMTRPLSELKSTGYILLIPGGTGAREWANDTGFIATLENPCGTCRVYDNRLHRFDTPVPDRPARRKARHVEQTGICLDKNSPRGELGKKKPGG